MRQCKDCEYFRQSNCFFNPPTVSGVGTHSYQNSSYPSVNEDYFCSKWEPIWEDNEVLNEAWKEFQLILKMTKER